MSGTKEPRAPYQILKENLTKIEFNFMRFDNQLILTEQTHRIIENFGKEFYIRKEFPDQKLGWLKRTRFNRMYRNNPKYHQGFINPQTIDIQNFSQATPGRPIDVRLIIGYFKPVKNDSGSYFRNPFMKPIEPLQGYIQIVMNDLKKLIRDLGKHHDKTALMTKHFKDLALAKEALNFVAKLFSYANSYHLPQLKSGHLLALVSGLRSYLDYLMAQLAEMGFTSVSVNDYTPLLTNLDTLINEVNLCLLDIVFDMLTPLAETINLRLEWSDGELEVIDTSEIEKGFFSRLLDFFGRIFGKKTAEKQEKDPGADIKPIQLSAEEPMEHEIPEQKKEKVVDSRNFVELRATLKKIIDEFKNDLSPEYGEKGKVTDYRNMFDQFDLPTSSRDLTYTNFVLNGKLVGVDLMNLRYQDQIIVSSTHWLYDRIFSIISYYKFSEEGILLSQAQNFFNDVRSLFYVEKNETDETKRYGTMPQLRINIKRIFSSTKNQSKYNALINAASNLLDKIRSQLNAAKFSKE